MNRPTIWLSALMLSLLSASVAGCEDQPSTPLAPTASALAPAKPPSAEAKKFEIDKVNSKVEFMMDAPQEKIRGRVPGATEGTLQIDLMDITKTSGLLKVDISGIELFQAIVDEKTGKFGEEKKQELQNQHARTWLEISDDAPEDVRKKNARVEFSIKSIENASAKDVTKMSGAERNVTLTAKGEFLLHGRKTDKTVELAATFKFEGDKAVAVTVKTVKPFAIGLAEHDVHPREAFGKLAQKTLEVLAPKVAKEAQVSIELTANLQGMTSAAAPAAPASVVPAAMVSAAPAASSSAAPAASAAPKK